MCYYNQKEIIAQISMAEQNQVMAEQILLCSDKLSRHFLTYISPTADHYTYTENGSKNHPGQFGVSRASNKVVTIYANSDSEPRCLVYLLDFYFSK